MTQLNTENPILIDLPMPIETDRLILRPALPGDGKVMNKAILDSWAELNRWLAFAQKKPSLDASEANARKSYSNFILRKDIHIHGFEKETGDFVISSGIHRFDWSLRRFEIGYWTTTQAAGKGYATETANALARYAFDVMQARCVNIQCANGNGASLRVAEKLKFKKEGVLIGASIDAYNKSVTDIHSFVCTSPESLPPLKVSWGKKEWKHSCP